MPLRHSINTTPGILLMLWALSASADALADDTSDSTADAEQSPILPEPSEDIDDLMRDRDENDDASVASDDYPAIPGCAPLEGDREALPLADRAHRMISETLCDPAEQLDDALADPNDSVPENSEDAEPQQLAGPPETGTAVLRMSIQADLRPDASPEPGAGLSASVRLPQMYQRLTLFAQRQAENMVDMEADEEDASGLVWVARPAVFLLSRTDVGLRGYAPSFV